MEILAGFLVLGDEWKDKVRQFMQDILKADAIEANELVKEPE